METMLFTDNQFFKDLDEAARFYSMPLTEQEEYEYLQRNRLIRQLNEDFKIKKAEEKGEAKGREEGEAKERLALALKFKELGTDVSIIQQATGLTLEEINNL